MHVLIIARNVNLEITHQEEKLQNLITVKGEKDQIVTELQNSLRSFEQRKRAIRIERQRLEDTMERITNELEENVTDNRLSNMESTLEVSIEQSIIVSGTN